MAKKRGIFAKLLGSLSKLAITGCQFIFVILSKIIWKFGLIIPLVYLVFGGILSLFTSFKPFNKSIESAFYIGGLIISCFCSLIVTVRNFVVKPVSNFKDGYKHPVWQKKEEVVLKPKKHTPKLLPIDRENVKTVELLSVNKYPKRYYSVLEEDTIIYEYKDRFEVFKTEDDSEVYLKTEYK